MYTNLTSWNAAFVGVFALLGMGLGGVAAGAEIFDDDDADVGC